MRKKPCSSRQARKDRRRFLRESLRGAVPLLLGVGAGPPEAPDGAQPAATSAPPEATGPDGAAGKGELDRLQETFALDNPDMSEYPNDG